MRKDLASWVALAVVTAAYAALPWALEVVPGHDLPQHLAYARVLADLGHASPDAAETFYAVRPFDTYFLVHHALAALSSIVGVVPACKLVYSVFAASLPLSAYALGRAVWREAAPWPALAATCLVWSPVACMGFLPFMLALPLALLAVAAYVRAARSKTRARIAVVAVAFAALSVAHVVAAAMALGFALLHALVARRAPAFVAAAAGLVGAWLPSALRAAPSRVGWSGLVADVLTHGPVAGTVGHFRMTWTGAREKLGLVLGTVPGPFTPAVQRGLLVLVVVAAGVLATAPRGAASVPSAPEGGGLRRAYLWACAGFGLVGLVVPTAVQVPDDVCLVDLRMLVVAALFGCAALSPRLFAPRRAKLALAGVAASLLVAWSFALAGVSREAAPVVHLVAPLGPRDRVLGLAMHGSSAHLDPSNALTHYLPVYALALRGAPVTSFWGDFAPHLPVGWRAAPPRPPDWAPWKVEAAQLEAATHVLLERADEDDDDAPREATARVTRDASLEALACEARWCLFRVRPAADAGGHVTARGTAVSP